MVTAPIAFFAFNRPDHARQSLAAIKANRLAGETLLYIFCDGPRPNESADGLRALQEVRQIAESDQWCGEVEFRFRDHNLGLYDSIVGGVTEVVEKHGRVITIEDDVITSPGFLEYMNSALDLYADDDRVMHISGYAPIDDITFPMEEETFFFNHTFVWGWGTWQRAWRHFDRDGYRLMKMVRQRGLRSYVNLDDSFEFYWGLKYVHERHFADWNYNWHTAVNLRGGLCLQPRRSLTRNIGFDGSGTHCNGNSSTGHRELVERLIVRRIALAEHKAARRMLTRIPLLTKLKMRGKHLARIVWLPIRDRWRARFAS